jgi:hyperosmotically inducible periplasmic protein
MEVRNMNAKNLVAAALAAIALAGAYVAQADESKRSVGEYTDDKLMVSKVKTALISDKTADADEINVEVYKGVVQLNGFVDSEKEKAQAETVAKAVEGVKGVTNNLQIKQEKHTAGAVMDDSALTAKVKSALIDDPRTKAGDIKVETRNGVVQLSGYVSNESQKAAAGSVAQAVTGVKSVSNGLSIKQ